MALDVLKHHTESRRILTKVGNGSARALHNLSGVTLSVDLAETAPLTEHLLLGDLDQRNLTLSAKSLRRDTKRCATHLNETLVLSLIAILSKEANLGDIAVQGLDGQTETALESLVMKSVLQHFRDGGHGVHLGDDVHAINEDNTCTVLRFSSNGSSFLSHSFNGVLRRELIVNSWCGEARSVTRPLSPTVISIRRTPFRDSSFRSVPGFLFSTRSKWY